MTILVIVESPAKCQKIESYLGPGYKCIASYGHLRELKGLKQIDIENNFALEFSVINEPMKLKQIEKIRKEINLADEVILATDDDREGEAIAWHICDLFDLSVEHTKRILFHEITKDAIQKAIADPVKINIELVNAQKARQILDLLVGFTVSPILWKCISQTHAKSLSAGRCQSPALRLIYDNYLETKECRGEKVYSTIGYFTNKNLPFELNHYFGNEEEVEDFLENTLNFTHILQVSKPKESIQSCPEPLTTSSLQQLSSNELHLSPKETMKYAQQLYENGLITYMRTDSKTYSKDFVKQAEEFLLREYNDVKYINPEIKKYIDDNNKGAHEAVRPVSICLKTADGVESKAKKLYDLIWKRTVESCMNNAVFYYVQAEINSYQNHIFKYRSDQVHFPGWKIVAKKYEDSNPIYYYLLSLQLCKSKSDKDSCLELEYKKIVSTVTVKNIKQHYSEAKLVQLLEEKGIGRPSTFSSLVDKIQERGYVLKENVSGITVSCKDYVLEGEELGEKVSNRVFGNEKNKLVIQPLGILVIEFIIQRFEQIFNYDYTKKMEDELDIISQGKMPYYSLCEVCYQELKQYTDKISPVEDKCNIKIDEQHSYIIGKHGPIIKQTIEDNTKFFAVKKDIDLRKLERGEYSLEDIIETTQKETVIGKYQNEDLFLKKGKYGIYVEWGKNKKSLNQYGNIELAEIKYLDVIKFLEKDTVLDPSAPVGLIRNITKNANIRAGKFGDYIFYKTGKMKKPRFLDLKGFTEDYKTCPLENIKKWVKEVYNVE